MILQTEEVFDCCQHFVMTAIHFIVHRCLIIILAGYYPAVRTSQHHCSLKKFSFDNDLSLRR